MAAASLVLTAAPAAETYQSYDSHRQLLQQVPKASNLYPHYRLIIAGGCAFTAGLVLAPVGFWILGTAFKVTTDTASSTPGIEHSPVAAVTEIEPAP